MKIKIEFQNITDNVVSFKFTGNIEWEDRVKIDEWNTTDFHSREALSFYGFWRQLKELIDEKNELECNNVELLRYFYNLYSKETFCKDPWPF